MASSPTINNDLPVQEWPEWHFFDAVNDLLAEVISRAGEADSDRIGVLYPFLDSIQESTASLSVPSEF